MTNGTIRMLHKARNRLNCLTLTIFVLKIYDCGYKGRETSQMTKLYARARNIIIMQFGLQSIETIPVTNGKLILIDNKANSLSPSSI